MPRKDPIPTSLLETPLTRRTVLEAFGIGGFFLAGCAPGTTETPKASPSEANAPSTPEKPIPKDIYNASWEDIKPLTQAELYPQDNPHFSPDYIMGADTSDDGHLNEIPELFAINLDPSDYDTDKEFVDAYVKSWFDRYNALSAIGLSGRGDNSGSDRPRLEQAAIDIYREMTGKRKDATVPERVVNDIMVSGNAKCIYSRTTLKGQADQYPLANVVIPDMDSVRYTGTPSEGLTITVGTRMVWKANQDIIWMDIGPTESMRELDGVTMFTLSDVKVDPSTHRVAAKSSWDKFKNRLQQQ
ncbi:MAG: hypothetical protein WBO49_04695 [Candidatus Saccharimonas sp.]